jgi:hypothetical protein
MTRKHFNAIAVALLEAKELGDLSEQQLDLLVSVLLPVFRSANPNFDSSRFRSAVGL